VLRIKREKRIPPVPRLILERKMGTTDFTDDTDFEEVEENDPFT
jgi:hypothetical protein